MKFLRQGICLIVLGAALSAAPGLVANAAKDPTLKPADRTLVQQLRSAADGSVALSGESATGKVNFARAGRNGDLLPGNSNGAAAKADAFLARYGSAFGAPRGQLVKSDVTRDKYGSTVTYTQEYQGVSVYAALIRVHVDGDGDLTSVNGEAVPISKLSVDPAISSSEIASRAVSLVRATPPGENPAKTDTSGLRAVKTDLVVYRQGLVRGEVGKNVLSYVIEVTNQKNIRDMVFLDANTGKILNRYSMIHDALDRKLYEASPDTPPVWEEGEAFPGTLNQDQQNLVLASGESYWFFMNGFNRDSYDAQGATMKTVNNDPTISCPNANWNGVTTNYCNGVTSDDVVAHEWGHAYTEYTHGLIYQWQPGALNESYSDIWGETVDLINGRQDEDETNGERADGACSTNTAANPVVVINTPASIARVCAAGAASFGPQVDATGVTADVVQGIDADEDRRQALYTTTDGCSPLDNAAEVAGKIVIVDRGGCAFTQKATTVDATDAIGLIIGNNVAGPPNGMSGDVPVSIPTVQISQENRNAIVSQLASGVNVTMKDAGGARENSYRWLVGEDSSAFGGAIRDMWTPTCLGDPGKVSDAEYKCSTDDQGGVHSNSGVPNHGYALLVDGGTYNGVTVPSIGTTKASHIYYRAMTNYQTPSSDFTDHADSLASSCVDLTGQSLAALSTKANDASTSPEVITAADCAAVDAMSQAVELRTEPTQCNFQPLLAKDAPSLCASGQNRTDVFTENFEDGLAGWDVASSNVYGGPEFPWEADTTLPSGRVGSAAYAFNADGGQCDGSTSDHSSVTTLTSPAIALPGGRGEAARVAFDHYVATENGFDGGNVKVAVNRGGFEVIPASAYTYNKPTTIASAAEGNTNPLSGEDGFTGTDGGEVTGSWGQSQVDLTMMGVRRGDTIRLRFDFGQDGCSGVDGWYVDDVQVSTCLVPKSTGPKGRPAARSNI